MADTPRAKQTPPSGQRPKGLKLGEIEASLLGPGDKGIPGGTSAIRLDEIGRQGWNVLREDLPLPVAVLKRSALDFNAAWMQRFAEQHGVLHSPHGKTLVGPQIYARQLAAGAWAITVATVHQLQVCRRFGVERVLLANQLVGKQALRFVLDEIARDPGFDSYCLADSLEGVAAMAEAARARRPGRPLQVLVDFGLPDGRTGCRTSEAALAVARAVKAASPALALCGVSTYEGIIDEPRFEETAAKVESLLARTIAVAEAADREGLLDTDAPILCAGGSQTFDLVAAAFRRARLAGTPRIVIRSGGYLYLDSGFYADRFTGTLQRLAAAGEPAEPMRPALEIWAYVQSLPEPGKAILGMGRREASFAYGYPVPLVWHRPGRTTPPQAVPPGHRVTQLNDHHAFLDLPEGSPLRFGDLVGLGGSNPCAIFDRWRLIFVVEDDYTVVSAIRNYS